jgi:hypothetical protein
MIYTLLMLTMSRCINKHENIKTNHTCENCEIKPQNLVYIDSEGIGLFLIDNEKAVDSLYFKNVDYLDTLYRINNENWLARFFINSGSYTSPQSSTRNTT